MNFKYFWTAEAEAMTINAVNSPYGDPTPPGNAMKCIPLTQGKHAMVDDADYEHLIQWKWFVRKNKNNWYAVRTQYLGGGRKHPKNKTILMHREIITPPAGLGVDHIDHNGLNNQRSNLRLATNSQNHQNENPRSGTVSRYKGVNWHKGYKRWQVRIQLPERRVSLGYFHSEIYAAGAYDAAARKYFGDFAYCNFSLALTR